MDEQPGARGAYGICLDGVAGAARLLAPADPDWPVLRVEQKVVPPAERIVPHWDDEGARFNLPGGGTVEVDRAAMTASFELPERADDQHLVHPFLSGSAAIVSRWLGRETLHGGTFVVDGGAWAVLGEKGSGKSSTLGWLARQGVGVVTDDLVVIDGGTVLAGPSCIDLRGDAAAVLGLGEPLGVVGARERWRAVVPSVPPRVPLAGWVLPSWGDRIDVKVVPAQDRLPWLLGNLTLRAVVDPITFLDLAQLPTLELCRPASWDAIDPAMTRLLEVLGQGGPPRVASATSHVESGRTGT